MCTLECTKPETWSHCSSYIQNKCRCPLCKAAGQEYSRKYYKRKVEELGAGFQYPPDRKEKIDNYKIEHGCGICGYSENPLALDFHHRPGEIKIFTIARGGRKGKWSRVLAEIGKCDILCANCHRIITYSKGAPCLTSHTKTNQTGPRSPDTTN